MPLKKIVKVLAVVAVFGISVAQAGANDYGVSGANDYGVSGAPKPPAAHSAK